MTHFKIRKRVTRAEYDVLKLLAEGYRPAEVAEKLCISSHTVAAHTRNVRLRLDMRTTLQAAVYVVCEGLIPYDELDMLSVEDTP